MLAQTIQRQVTIGDNVKFLRKDGYEISGRLVELSQDHITLDNSGKRTTILLDMVGGWEVLQDALQPVSDESISETVISEQENDTSVISEQENISDVKVDIPPDSNFEEALRITLEIEARFQANLAAVKLDLPRPDFDLSEEEFRGKQISSALDRIKSKYEYALKVSELGAQYGRIQPLISELEKLIVNHPDSSVISRLLGYFYRLTGNGQKAIEMYKKAASASDSAKDWYGLAVLADNDALSCYGFKKVYSQVGVSEYLDAWYVFVNLMAKHGNYSDLAYLSSNQANYESYQGGRSLLEACLYLLLKTGNRDAAIRLASLSIGRGDYKELVDDALNILAEESAKASPEYLKAIESFKPIRSPEPELKPIPQLPAKILQGHIYVYKTDRIFGFIRGVDGKTFFFHRSAVSDEELREQLRDFKGLIHVTFETTEGPKGPIALNISLPRVTEKMFERAVDYAENGDYPQAINQMKKVLRQNPDYPSATELYEKWREYARISTVPRGTNPYARARREHLFEKDLDKAVEFFEKAIREDDHFESAVKELAILHTQRGNPQESVRILLQYRRRVSDQRAVDSMLVNFHFKAGQYDEAIKLLEAKLGRASSNIQKTRVQMQIASCYLHKEDYSLANSQYKKIIGLRPNMLSAHRNIALCAFKLGDYEEAEKILSRILDTSPDFQAEELLEAIRQERAGQQSNIEEITIETTLPNLSNEISKFTEFFLGRCAFQGVPPTRVKEVQEGRDKFNRRDVESLEGFARQSGTKRPRERAESYLSAAKILLTMEDSDPDDMYRYLGRSFALTADAAVAERKRLDAARDLYAESLSIYDGYRSGSSDDQEASNALVRFLFSTLGESRIPTTPDIPSVDETLETVLTTHTDTNRAFDAIAYLVFRSPRFAASRILGRLNNKSQFKALAVKYLESQGVEVSRPLKRLNDFASLWNEIIRRTAEEFRQVSFEFRLMMNTKINTASLEDSSQRVRDIIPKLFLESDQERLRQLEKIFISAHELCRQSAFEERERLCNLIKDQCQALANEIETAPTKISIEELLPLVSSLQGKISAYLEKLYEESTPELTLRLAVESYSPSNDGDLEVQVTVSNRMGRSPAEALELVVVAEEDSDFTLTQQEIKLDSSLRGGDQRILLVPLRVGRKALNSQVFSLPIYAQFRSRLGESDSTQFISFPIRLYSEADFEEIGNPYAAYASGGIVGDPSMFFGRGELITNVANSIRYSHSQSKCVVIYGQKRAGKSSILYHLKTQLEKDVNLLILDIGNIGAIYDENSPHPLLYQILWAILQKLQYAIEDRVEDGMQPIDLAFPSDLEFFRHPTPLGMFREIFQKFQRSSSRIIGWKEISAVLLVDEFSYLYGWIVARKLPDSFMKNWKALLQENFFNAVLVGQDVMPKFQQRYPNEFGATQDERVTYLQREDAIRLIDEPMRLGGPQGDSRYREKALERILDLTASSPFYIQILCNRIVTYMNRERSKFVTEADVEQVKEDLIRGVNALGLDEFDNLINPGDTSADAITDEDALAVLRAIARNSNNPSNSCSQDSILCETASSVRQILDDLVRRDVLERQRTNYYSIRVGLFKEWLLVHQ